MVELADPRAAIDVIEGLRGQFTQRDAEFRAMDAIIYGENEIRIPEAYEQYAMSVHTRLAFFAAHVITSTLCANPLQVQFAPVRQGMPGDENATLRENWHEAAWDRQRADAAPRRLYEAWMWSLVTKGFAVLKTMRRSDRLWSDYYRKSKGLYGDLRKDTSLTPARRSSKWNQETEQYKREVPFPIVSNVVPSESFWYLAGDDGLKLAAEAQVVPYNRLYDDFKRMKELDPSLLGVAQPIGRPYAMGGDDLLTLYQLWDHDTVTYIVEGVGQEVPKRFTLAAIKHGLGDPRTKTLCGPYSIAMGITTDHTAHHHASKGALWAFAEVLPMLDATLTASGEVAFLTGFPLLKRTARPGPLQTLDGQNTYQGTPSDEEQDEYPVFEPGMVMPLGVEFAQPPQNGQQMAAFMANLKLYLEPLLPASAYGDGPAESGYAQNQRIHMNTLVWSSFVHNAQDAMAHRCEVEDRLIEQIGEPVYVDHWEKQIGKVRPRAQWQALGPEDVAGIYTYRCLIQPTTPGNEELLTRMLGEQIQMGLETRAGAAERLGRNFDQLEQQRWTELILDSDQMKQGTLQQIMQELGAGDMALVQQANEQLAALAASGYGQQQPPGGMPTSGPGGPPGGMGPAGMPVAPHQGLPGQPTPAGSVDGPAPPIDATPLGPVPSGARQAPSGSYPLPGQR